MSHNRNVMDQRKRDSQISVDDFMTLQSMLDAKIASALEKIISNPRFRRSVSVEEQTAQKYYRFRRGRQIAYMIYDHIRVTGPWTKSTIVLS